MLRRTLFWLGGPVGAREPGHGEARRAERYIEGAVRSLRLLHQAFELTLKGRREFETLDLQAMRQTLRILESLTRLAERDPERIFRPAAAPATGAASRPSGSQIEIPTLAGSAAEAMGEVFDFLKSQKEYWGGRDDTAQGSLDDGGGVEKPEDDSTGGGTTTTGNGSEGEPPATGNGTGTGGNGTNGNGGPADNGGGAGPGAVSLGGGVVTLPDGSIGVAGTAHGAPEGSTVEILDGAGNKIGEIPDATDADGRFSGFFPSGGPLAPGMDISLKVGDTVLPVGPVPAPIPVSF